MTEEIKNGNIQIALFEGYHLVTPSMRKNPKEWLIAYWEKPIENNVRDAMCSEDSLSYHISWQYLMRVVEKISRTKIGDGIKYVDYSYPRTFGMLNTETGQIMVRLNGYPVHEADTLIEACWLAVVEYCKHYNETHKLNESS